MATVTRPIENIRLTRNFKLYEFIEAHPFPKSRVGRAFIEHNWKHYKEFERNYTVDRSAEFSQWMRDIINERWRADNGGKEIRLRVTSAFRNSEHEDARKRKGEHRRTAVDAQPNNVSLQLGVRILSWLHDKLTDHEGGLAIKHATYEKGILVAMGFVHVDWGLRRRWKY